MHHIVIRYQFIPRQLGGVGNDSIQLSTLRHCFSGHFLETLATLFIPQERELQAEKDRLERLKATREEQARGWKFDLFSLCWNLEGSVAKS